MKEIIRVRLKKDIRERCVFQNKKEVCNIHVVIKKNKYISFEKLQKKHEECQEINGDYEIIIPVTPTIELEVSNTDISQELYEIIRGLNILSIPSCFCYIRKDICDKCEENDNATKRNKAIDAYNFFIAANKQCSEEEREKLECFYKYLYSNPHKVKILYRGEKYDCIKRKMGLMESNDEDKMITNLFLIGEKGKAYQKEYREKIKEKKKIYPIDCIDDDFIKYIFWKYWKILSKEKEEIVEFVNRNRKFADYFKNGNNKNNFCKKIKQEDKKEAIKLRDYYLIPLHHIGGIGFNYNSFFVSTTTDLETAKGFANNGESSSEKIILVSWIEYPFNKIGFSFNYLNCQNKKIKNIGLPTYDKSFFQKQNEISLKGGIFPHYLLGYFKINANEFVPNPHLFTTKKHFDKIIQEGFDIDQSDFLKKLEKTDYERFIWLDLDGEEYTDCNSDLSLN